VKELADKCRDVRRLIGDARGYLEIGNPKKSDKYLEIAENLMNEVCFTVYKMEKAEAEAGA